MYTVFIDYIICKVIILLFIFRYTFVNSIRSVHFLWTVLSSAYNRINLLCHGVVNWAVTYKDRNDINSNSQPKTILLITNAKMMFIVPLPVKPIVSFIVLFFTYNLTVNCKLLADN